MNSNSPTVAIIGLGAMGSALASSLVDAGTAIAVWNRTARKTEPLANRGAMVCSDPATAISQCETVVVCVSTYLVWKDLIKRHELDKTLKSKILIQLTTGTLDQVEDHAAWAKRAGAGLIEGAILCFPDQIGREDASIVVAGAHDDLAKVDHTLRTFAPSYTMLGETLTAPVVLSRAVISSVLGFLIGTINGAAMCKAGDVPLETFSAQLTQRSELLKSEPQRVINAIAQRDTIETQAALSTWGDGQKALLEVAKKQGINPVFQQAMRRLFEQAEDIGVGQHDLSAMIAVFERRQ